MTDTTEGRRTRETGTSSSPAAGLPAEAFILHPEDGRLIMVRRGVSGFFPIIRDPGDLRTNAELADVLNGGPLAPEIAEAMLAGSMFGWHVPAADPQTYIKKA